MIKFGNFIVTDNNSWLSESSSPGPTPPTPVLPAGTVRVRTSDGNAPIKYDILPEWTTSYETATLVEGTTDVYDVYKSGTSFKNLLNHSANVVEVIAANTTGITDMHSMFFYCTSLTSVPLFDTSSVTDIAGMFSECTSLTSVPLFDTSNVIYMYNMFAGCTSLTTVPLFDTSNVTFINFMFSTCRSLTSVPLFDTSNATHMYDMFAGCTSLTSVPLFDTSSCEYIDRMFYDCPNVESGALALYQQASTQANPPSDHNQTFTDCGANTITGAAELAQIPSDWK
jgi:surface protein